MGCYWKIDCRLIEERGIMLNEPKACLLSRETIVYPSLTLKFINKAFNFNSTSSAMKQCFTEQDLAQLVLYLHEWMDNF